MHSASGTYIQVRYLEDVVQVFRIGRYPGLHGGPWKRRRRSRLLVLDVECLASLQPVRLAMTRQSGLSDCKGSGHYSVDDLVLVPGYISAYVQTVSEVQVTSCSFIRLYRPLSNTEKLCRWALPSHSEADYDLWPTGSNVSNGS
jgi:hypothetical protein